MTSKHPYQTWWKKPLGERCPHGKEFFLVSGSYVRDNFDSDFVQGGNGGRYRFISKRELWIDDSLPRVEWPFVAQHECEEAELMKAGMSYGAAHDRAKRHEDALRRKYRPGSKKRTKS